MLRVHNLFSLWLVLNQPVTNLPVSKRFYKFLNHLFICNTFFENFISRILPVQKLWSLIANMLGLTFIYSTGLWPVNISIITQIFFKVLKECFRWSIVLNFDFTILTINLKWIETNEEHTGNLKIYALKGLLISSYYRHVKFKAWLYWKCIVIPWCLWHNIKSFCNRLFPNRLFFHDQFWLL